MRDMTQRYLKLALAAFAAAVCAIAVVLPYEARKKYIQAWLLVKKVVNTIF